MSATEDVARMLTLVPWLLERPGASVSEAAQAFAVDERTIRRDLNHLDFCGLPGLGGGDLFDVSIVGERIVVQMADELRRPLRLTPREALRLVLVVDAVSAALGEELPALRSALNKIRAAAGVPAGVSVQLDDGSRWFEQVRSAVTTKRQIQLTYQGRSDDEPRDRLVDPWGLHVVEGNWYLHGHDHKAGAGRTFRLDRVAGLTVLDEPATMSAPDGPLPTPAYLAEPGDVRVELLLAPGARWLAEMVEPDSREERQDGRQHLMFQTDALPWIERLLLMAGTDVEVLEPRSLAVSVREEARRALDRYR